MSYTSQRLRERIAILETDGPQIERAREDGNVIMGSMRECLEDARMALAAEESIAEVLRRVILEECAKRIPLMQEAHELRVRVAELDKDAARYRFLEADFSPMGLDIDGNHVWAYRRNASLKGPTLSDAIDAAMKG